jgi:glycosyltransferase involved in cell wall biosynthesis
MVAYTNYLTDARPRREAETLAARGDEIDFIALAEKDHPSEEVVNGVRVLRLSQSRYRGGNGLMYIAAYLQFFLRVLFQSTLLHLRRHYDAVHVHTMPDILVFAALLPKLTGAKVILDVHDMMPELYMSKFGIRESHPLIWLLKMQEKASISFADRVICVHDPHKNVLQRRHPGAGPFTVLLNVPDPHIFGRPVPPNLATEKYPRFVYHGTIARRLGLDLAVEAFAKVLQQLPQSRFSIYGDGDYSEEIEKITAILKVKDAVTFSRKFFRVEEIPRLVQGATAGIIPNRKDSATEYMLPVKLLEYVYLGIPVVAPRLHTIQYYFDEQSVAFYDAGDAGQLAELMTSLWNDPSRRLAMATRAQERISSLSWESMKDSLFEVVDRPL